MKLISRLLRTIPWLVALFAATALVLLAFGQLHLTVEAPGEIVIEQFEVLRAEVPGQLIEVLVAPGDRVAPGALVAQLEDRELKEKAAEDRRRFEALALREQSLKARRNELAEKLQPLELAQERSELERLRSAVELEKARQQERKVDLEVARQREKRLEQLAELGLVSGQALQEAQLESQKEEWRLRQSAIEQEQQGLSLKQRLLTLERLRREQVWSLEEKDEELRHVALEKSELARNVVDLERRLVACRLTTREGGWVAGLPAAELFGRWVEPGTELLRVVAESGVVFLALVSEEDRVKVEPGQKALLELRGLPKKKFREFYGRVRAVSALPTVSDLSAKVVYSVTIEIDEPWVEIDGRRFIPQSGMSGVARISVKPNASWGEVLLDIFR